MQGTTWHFVGTYEVSDIWSFAAFHSFPLLHVASLLLNALFQGSFILLTACFCDSE